MKFSEMVFVAIQGENGIQEITDSFYMARFFGKNHEDIKKKIDLLNIPHKKFIYGKKNHVIYNLNKSDLINFKSFLFECELQQQHQITENSKGKVLSHN